MLTTRNRDRLEPARDTRRELVRPVRPIQAPTPELSELRQQAAATPELRAREHMLDQVPRRLVDDPGGAA